MVEWAPALNKYIAWTDEHFSLHLGSFGTRNEAVIAIIKHNQAHSIKKTIIFRGC